jgi:carbon-monoxide dehydrogenase medium subunit
MRDVEHFSPETLDEAAALLLAAGGQTHALARGTDLIAEATEGRRTLCMVLDLKRIPELNRLDYDERNGLRVGAAVPVKTILQFPPVRQLYPMLADAYVPIGPGELPDSATLGGDLSDASSAAEVAPPFICVRASAAVFGPYGWSELGVEALLAGAGRIVLQPGEFVVDLRFPAPPPRSNGVYLRAAPQERSDAVAGVGVFLVLEQDLATCCGARLTVCGTTPKPMRALEAERFLSGKLLEEAVLNEAADLTARCAPRVARSAEEGLELVRELTRRAITATLERARAGGH